MSGNSIGRVFTVTTWGESHGKATGVVIDGCPPGIDLSVEDLQKELDRRKPGGDPFSSPRKEEDRVEILSGIFEDRTTGTPLSLMVMNRDAKSRDYDMLRDIYRPGHGDYSYDKKYGMRDYRGGGRASGRETLGRVAAGAVAKKIILTEGVTVVAYTQELGGIAAACFDESQIGGNSLCCPDGNAAQSMEAALDEARRSGDTLGGVVEILVRGCPAGLGEPVFDKMDADLAKGLMSIGTVKAVEVGAGREAARLRGSEMNDPIGPDGFLSNNAGGILAGITTGDTVVLRVSCKPIPSIAREQQTIDRHGNAATVRIGGRHDISVIPRIIPVCEAMTAIVLADHLLRQRTIQQGHFPIFSS